MADVLMPKLSDSMVEGTIVRWCKRGGEHVSAGEALVEIETDKATIAYEAEHSGVVSIVASDGDVVAVGAIIGQIETNGSAPRAPDSGGARGVRDTAAGSPGNAAGRRPVASPVARRLAEQLGVDLHELHGSGPSGRVVKRDVEAARAARTAVRHRPAPAEPGSAAAPPIKGEVETRPLTSIQLTIARRMAQAKSTMPEFTLTTEVDMDAALQLRAQLEDLGRGRAPSVNDLVIRACALALREHPKVNASYCDGGFDIHGRVNIGVAVATADALLVPTVLDADAKSLHQIASESRALAERARAGTLTPAELSGGTFTVSNLGMFGITHFTAVLNPPQAAILAVGSVRERVALRDGAAVACHLMSLTLTCDHRILYGADAAAFLQRVRAWLEQPLGLLV